MLNVLVDNKYNFNFFVLIPNVNQPLRKHNNVEISTIDLKNKVLFNLIRT
jgi:hypothetical protein